jgi:glutathione S-transferase
MSELTLVIGNKNYSSWSLRPWLFLRHHAVPFLEIRIALDQPDTAARIADYSPAGRVPVLLDGSATVWESLAICEHVAERCAIADAWPADPAARALARALAHEMHAGFPDLRRELPMNCRAGRRRVALSPAAQRDVDRVMRAWTDCRQRFGVEGPWLFGGFSITDAMFAPVALRFRTYGLPMPEVVAGFTEAVLAHPAVADWIGAARLEPEIIDVDEAGEPVPD